MAIFDRFRTGIALTRDSVSVMRDNPRLLLFPVVSGVAAAAFLGTFLGITFGVFALDLGSVSETMGQAFLVALVAGLALVYLGTTFITSFFTAALVHQVRAVLAGDDPSLRAGISGAWQAKGPLLAWSVISATVGLVLNAIENSDSKVGQLLSLVFGVAWTLLTFFVIPVIVFEEPSIRGMFERSAATFRDTWGETSITLGGVSVLAWLAAVPFAAGGYYLWSQTAFEFVGIGLFVVGVLVATLLANTLQGIIKTTLYLYATEGTQAEEFSDIDFEKLANGDTDSSVATGGNTTTVR